MTQDWKGDRPSTFDETALVVLDKLHVAGIRVRQDGEGNARDARAAGMAARLLEKGFTPRYRDGIFEVVHRTALVPLYSSRNRVTIFEQTGRKLDPAKAEYRCASILLDIAYGRGDVDVSVADWSEVVAGYHSK